MITPTASILSHLAARAFNDATRLIAHCGCALMAYQADDLGEEVIDWMRARLHLDIVTLDTGAVHCLPDVHDECIVMLGEEAAAAGDDRTERACTNYLRDRDKGTRRKLVRIIAAQRAEASDLDEALESRA